MRPCVAGWTLVAGAGRAAWTALTVPLNVWFLSSIGAFYDPQDDEQRYDALAGAASGVYTAGVQLGHGIAVFLVIAAHARRSWIIAPTAGAGLALCQLAVAVPLGVAQLTALNAEQRLQVPDPTLRGDPQIQAELWLSVIFALSYPLASLLVLFLAVIAPVRPRRRDMEDIHAAREV